MRARHLLVIDDDECFTRIWGHILTQAGFSVTAVPNVSEAKAYLQQHTPDVILCDVNIPELDDHTFYTYLKASSRTRNIPVVMVGALGDEPKRTLSRKCGAKGYLEKPFSREQLMMVLHTVLEYENSIKKSDPNLDA
jgi:DNA-binding response OmpR family regulator